MWTSTANEAFGSFVVSWLDKNWVLQTRVLRCCVVKGRHTAFSIAAFLLQVASDFGLSQKVGVVRTDGASNCVAAGGVLGDVARQRVDADRICDFPAVGGSSDAAAVVAVDLGNAVGTEGTLAADGVGRGLLHRENDELAAIGGGGIGHAIASQLGTDGDGSRRGGAALSIGIESQGSAGSQAGPSGADGAGVALVDAAGRDFAESDDEGGDGNDLPDVGSDCGDGAEASGGVPAGASGTGDQAAAAQSRADAFCIELPTALHDGAIQSSDHARVSSFTWQHARCAAHTLQLSVRAGLAVPAVRSVLRKVRLVAKLSRTSTNFLRELGVAVDKEEAAAAELGGRERVHADALVSRLIIDCPTRWGSTLAMLCRFVRVGPEVPLALSTYFHYTQLSGRKLRVEGPNQPELDVLSEVITFLRVIESASASLGSEVVATGSMEEAVYWCLRRAGAPNRVDCAALSALKRAVLSIMRERREVERLRAPNPEWFGIRVAAVLLNPFYKSATLGGELSTETTARTTALAIIRWMVSGRMSVGGLLHFLQDESGMTVGFRTWEAAGVLLIPEFCPGGQRQRLSVNKSTLLV